MLVTVSACLSQNALVYMLPLWKGVDAVSFAFVFRDFFKSNGKILSLLDFCRRSTCNSSSELVHVVLSTSTD